MKGGRRRGREEEGEGARGWEIREIIQSRGVEEGDKI